MRRALLVIDLEGVAGVDTLGALVAGSLTYPAACAALTQETLAAVQGLLDAGFDEVRVSDSHRAGATRLNVDADALPEGTLVFWEEDAYSEALFEGVDAVACLGMHAAAGTTGFAAHTMDVHCGWSAGGRRLSETDIVYALAAERGVPALFSSGDDVLQASLKRGRAAFVVTKRAQGNRLSESRPPDEVTRALRQAARGTPVELRPLGQRPLRLAFKSRWQADLAAAQGARRTDARTVEVDGASFRARYDAARRACGASSARLGEVIRGMPGIGAFEEDATALVARPLRPVRSPDLSSRAARALSVFLEGTRGEEDWQRADRAITLHMLKGLSPAFFAGHALEPVLERSLQALTGMPATFGAGLDPFAGMARLDALYLERLHGLPQPEVDVAGLRDHLMFGGFTAGRLWGWLMGELAARAGVLPAPPHTPRVLRQTRRSDDLYWVTHLFLLQTGYFSKPLPPSALIPEREELLLAANWLCETRQVDLAAEVAFCLLAAGERDAAELASLLRLLSRSQRADGTVVDPAGGDARQRTHATAAALVAFAGAGEVTEAGRR